jgi:hypothetical protein
MRPDPPLPALLFGAQRVESELRFPGVRDPGDPHELVPGDRDADIFEVVWRAPLMIISFIAVCSVCLAPIEEFSSGHESEKWLMSLFITASVNVTVWGIIIPTEHSGKQRGDV